MDLQKALEILIMAGQLILGLSILVGLHEWGHMAAAKLFGMRVEKYFIGFPPKIFSFQKGETEYGIGAIPLGGFVKISGMIDESMDMDAINKEPQPWEFRSKPAWQRLIVMLGGIIVNVIVGIIIFIAIAYNEGERFLSINEVNKYGIVAGELAQEIGLKTGDKVVRVNGKPFTDFSDMISSEVFLGSNSSYTVSRNGQEVEIDIPNNFIEKLSDPDEKRNFIRPLEPFKIGELIPGMPAEKAGLETGDKVVSINGRPVHFFHEFQEELEKLKGKTTPLVVQRGAEQKTLSPTVSEEGTLGFYPETLLHFTTVQYTLGQAVAIGTENAFGVVYNNIKGFGKIFRGEVSASKALSGPIGIARMFGGVWDWGRFWSLTGLLSMVLAFMNALPIPALDGGHAVILSYEIISGRKPSDKFLENAQKVGMVLLLGLMAFAIFNDVWKAVFLNKGRMEEGRKEERENVVNCSVKPLPLSSLSSFLPFLPFFLSSLLLLTSFKPNHDYHVSVTQMQYNSSSRSFEVSIRIFTDDLEKALSQSHSKQRFVIKDNDQNDRFVEEYIRKSFVLTDSQKKNTNIKYIGKEQEADATWIYLEIPFQGALNGCKLLNVTLMEVFDDQVNMTNVKFQSEKKTFLFKKSQTSHTL